MLATFTSFSSFVTNLNQYQTCLIFFVIGDGKNLVCGEQTTRALGHKNVRMRASSSQNIHQNLKSQRRFRKRKNTSFSPCAARPSKALKCIPLSTIDWCPGRWRIKVVCDNLLREFEAQDSTGWTRLA